MFKNKKESLSFLIIIFNILFLSASCIAKGKVDITLFRPIKNSLLNLNVAEVKVLNNQLIINGSNLSSVTSVKLVNNGVTQSLTVESASNGELIANGISAISIGVGKVFDMILSNADAAATVPVSFTLDDNTVTGIKLNDMGANNNDVLTFNGTQWVAAAPFAQGLYQGTWDPASGAFPATGGLTDGDFYIVSLSGTYLTVPYDAGDRLILDGGSWFQIHSGSNSVSSYNGRNGLVVTLPADYVLLKNGSGKLPGSSLNDLANVDLTTTPPVNGNVLKFNGTTWVPGTSGGAAGAIGSTEITDLSITGGDIAENTINLSKLYSPSSDAALYLRGDKTWANFTAEVLNAPLSTYVLDATVKPTVMVTDKIGPALGKIQKYLNDLNTDYISKSASAQVVSGTFSFTSPTSFLYTQLPTGASPTEVANVQYVNNYVGAAVSGLSASAPATLTTANGAATSGDTTLNVVSTSGYPSAGTLLVGSEAISYTGTTATSFTGLTRGAYGTTAAVISNGATINNYLFLSKSTTTVTPKMVVTGNGNVGIGTSNPTMTVDIRNTAGTGFLKVDPANGRVNIKHPSNSAGYWDIVQGYADYNDFSIVQSGGLNRLTIRSGGLTGIGTITPKSRLDVLGNLTVGGTYAGANAAPANGMIVEGNVGIGTMAPTEKLEVSGNILLSKDANRSIRVDDSNVDGVNGGGLTLAAGSNSGNATANGGSVQISAGDGQLSGSGGSVSISAGNGGLINSTTGSVSIIGGGSNTTGANPGGAVSILGGWGFGATNAGGAVALTGGTALSGNNNGGSVVIGGGAGSGTGVAGNIILAATSGKVGIGTASPTAKLNIEDTAGTNAYGFILNHTGIGGSTGAALRAYQNAASSTAYAIMAEKTTQGGGAVFGNSGAQAGSSGTGVYGITYGAASSVGVAAHNVGINNTGYAVFANNNSATGWGVYSFGTSPNYFAGNVGIGNTAPAKLLHVGSASVGTGLAVANFQNIDGTCTITPASSGSGIACSSDERLKENFQDVKGIFALDKILQLQAVTYNFKTSTDDNRRTGYKAQEVQKIAPEFVRENEDGLLQVYYDAFIPWITEAIKSLNSEIKIQSSQIFSKADKTEVNQLKIENEKLKQENAAIKSRLEKIEKVLNLK